MGIKRNKGEKLRNKDFVLNDESIRLRTLKNSSATYENSSAMFSLEPFITVISLFLRTVRPKFCLKE